MRLAIIPRILLKRSVAPHSMNLASTLSSS